MSTKAVNLFQKNKTRTLLSIVKTMLVFSKYL